MKTNSIVLFLIAFLFSLKLLSQTYQTEKWGLLDITYSQKYGNVDPFEITFGAVITHENGKEMNVPGFYNGGESWVIRFSASEIGKWSFKTYSSLPKLAGKKGSIEVKENPDQDKHGPIAISKQNPQKFIYSDGTPYFLNAFEIDWLFALDAENPTSIPKTKKIIARIKENNFNQVVINVFAYDALWGDRNKTEEQYNFAKPKVFPFMGTNEMPDYSTLNVEFFKRFDRVITELDNQGIVAHLMIYVWNKKVNWPEPYSKADNLYFDYVVKRYQAYPNLIWDISKEALAYGRDDMGYITERIDRLKNLDAYNRLLSVHDYTYCSAFPHKVDFISIQEWAPNLYNMMLDVLNEYPEKPVFNIEHGGYETTKHTIFGGAYTDPLTCLRRNYECAFAGTYSTYYWQNTSWYEVMYEPETLAKDEQPNLAWYKHFQALFVKYDFNQLKPFQNNFTPFGLHDQKGTLLFFMPERRRQITGTAPFLKNKKVSLKWFDPLSGETFDGEERQFNEGTWLGFKVDQGITSPFCVAIIEYE